jgi:hypothetical protein
MTLFVSSCAYYHHVTGITAHTNGGAALTLTFNGHPSQSHIQRNAAEIVLFMEDKDLVDRLIVAINGVEPAAAPAPAPEPDEDIAT